jgi:large subunit ribosomal protein L31e
MVRVKTGEKRTYIIPLRKEWLKVPRWRRSKRAVDALQDYVQKHTKTENVRVSTWLNEAIWKHGGKNPPAKVEVEVTIENRKIQDKKTKKDIDTTFAVAELATIPKRITRLVKKKEDKLKTFKKEAPVIHTAGKDPKALAESLKKKISEKKKNDKKTDDKKEEKKKQAQVTPKQEMSMQK